MNIFKYNNLIKSIALTDFKLKYEGSILGYLWSLAKPLLMFSVLLFVFTQVFNIGDEIPYYPVYLLLGIVLWSFFTEATQTLMGSIAGKAHIIRKVYFPRITLPIANSFTAMMVLVANSLVVLGFLAYNQIPLNWGYLLLPALFFQLYILVLGAGLLLSSLYVKFRDIAHIWDVFLQAMFYGTPILYSPDKLPEFAQKIAMLNPMAQIIQDFRFIMISEQTITARDVLSGGYVWIPYSLPFIIFILGSYIFKRMSAKFAEEV